MMDGCSLLLRLLVVKQINKAARKAPYHKQHPVRRSGPLSDDIGGEGGAAWPPGPVASHIKALLIALFGSGINIYASL